MDKKPKIKNARLRGLVYIILSSILFVVLLVVSSYIHSKHNLNGVRVGEFLGILAFAMFACLLWVIHGIILLVKGEKKTDNTQNMQEAQTENCQTKNLQDKKEETQQNVQTDNKQNGHSLQTKQKETATNSQAETLQDTKINDIKDNQTENKNTAK